MFHKYQECGHGPRRYFAVGAPGGRGGAFMMGYGRGLRGGNDGNGRGGRRRVFNGDELKLILLKLIADAPRHGYDLIREIEELTGGVYAPSPGVIYPTLTLLDDMGFVAPTADTGKKQYAVTQAGITELTKKAAEVLALFARLSEMRAMRARTDGGPVRRSMGNLRAVLQNRLTADDVTAEMLHDVAAIIDDAAQKVERLRAAL